MPAPLRELILMRHAHALPLLPGQTDFARALSPQGELEAEAAGRWWQAQGLVVDRLLCSPAQRTRQTLAGLCAVLPGLPEAVFEPRLYEATPGMLLAAIEDAQAPRLALVAHNPGLEQLLLHFLGSDAWRALPTAAVAHLRLDARLPLASAGSAVLEAFYTP